MIQLASAEETIAKQLLEIEGLRSSKSNSDYKIKTLSDELELSKSEFEEERREATEVMTSMKQQLTSLEHQCDSQTEQYLKLDEELAIAKQQLAMMNQQLESEKEASENQVNSLVQKLKTLEKSRAELEADSELRLKEVQTELSNTHERLQEFQEKSAALELQLRNVQADLQHAKQVQQEVQVVTKEVEAGPTDQSQVEALKVSLLKLEADLAQASQLNEQLQKDKEDLSSTEQKLHAEVLDLQNQLSAVEKELSDQSEVYMNEITRLKEDMEKEKELNSERAALQLAEMHSSLVEQMDESTQEYELKLETVTQELNNSKDREKYLQDKLAESGVQNEKLLATVANLTESDSNWQRQITDLEHSQSQYMKEISRLNEHLQEYQEELNEARAELEKRASFDDEIDFVPISRSPSRSPYKSDSEAQGKLLTQMKCRLEELQRLLLKSKRDEDGELPSAELGLIQELLANNSALDSAAKRMRRDFEAKNEELSQFLARRDGELKQLQSEMGRKQKAMEALTASNMQQLLGRMSTFHGDSNTSLDKYRARIEAAAAMLESISASVSNQDQRHVRTLESVLGDLDQSQSEVWRYKDEVERLRAQLDQSDHHNTEEDHSTANGLAVRSVATGDLETTPSVSPGSSKRRVDEGSGQVIDEIDDAETRETLLQQQENEIRTLRDELDHAKRMEKRARATIDELEQDLLEKNRELKYKADDIQLKEREINKLEQRLSGVVNEPKLEEVSHTMEKDKLKIQEQQEQLNKVCCSKI